MNELYIIAQNAFTVSAADGIRAWEANKPRYMPFATTSAEKPVLEIDIQSRPLPKCDAERIYGPADNGIGLITARASRLTDRSIVMEFMPASDRKPRIWMRMPNELDRAEIIIGTDSKESDSYFLSHALMIAYMLGTCHSGTLLMHSATVIHDGKAYLFQGKSGTGKSTHAALWTRHIAGARLLNDDHPVVRFTPDGVATAYGSPWSGKTDCYRNLSAPVGAFVRIVRDRENALRRLAPLQAYASLTASVFYLPFLSDELKETRHKTIERLVRTVPCCEMHCRPDRDAAITCHRSLALNR